MGTYRVFVWNKFYEGVAKSFSVIIREFVKISFVPTRKAWETNFPRKTCCGVARFNVKFCSVYLPLHTRGRKINLLCHKYWPWNSNYVQGDPVFNKLITAMSIYKSVSSAVCYIELSLRRPKIFIGMICDGAKILCVPYEYASLWCGFFSQWQLLTRDTSARFMMCLCSSFYLLFCISSTHCDTAVSILVQL